MWRPARPPGGHGRPGLAPVAATTGRALCCAVNLGGIDRPLPLWRRVQPLAARALRGNAYTAGLLWGWLPCGLAYGALMAAVFAGGAVQGALAMAAFGAGTLPWLLAAGVLAARMRQAIAIRRAVGALLIGFGAWGVAHGVEQTILCL